MPDEDDDLDVDDFPGSAADEPTADLDVPYVALFAGVPDDEIEEHAAALRDLLR